MRQLRVEINGQGNRSRPRHLQTTGVAGIAVGQPPATKSNVGTRDATCQPLVGLFLPETRGRRARQMSCDSLAARRDIRRGLPSGTFASLRGILDLL